MQELWLQGHLDTLKKGGADEKLQEDVSAVEKLLGSLIQRRDGGLPAGEANGNGAMEA